LPAYRLRRFMLNRQQSGDQSAFSPPASSVRVRPIPQYPDDVSSP
jgi:hypothetical protein